MNLTDAIISFCITLLVTTSSLHLPVIAPWRNWEKMKTGRGLEAFEARRPKGEARRLRPDVGVFTCDRVDLGYFWAMWARAQTSC